MLVEKINSIDFDGIEVYSTKSFEKLMFLVPTSFLIVIIILFLF